jgi:ABC-type uncharacterized transport system YnjBCD permease subunit
MLDADAVAATGAGLPLAFVSGSRTSRIRNSLSVCLAIAHVALCVVLVIVHILPGHTSSTSGCVMTYMRPTYAPLPVLDRQRKYSLERYIEGSVRVDKCAPPADPRAQLSG